MSERTRRPTPNPPERRVLIAAFPEVELLDIAGPSSVFTTASRLVSPKRTGDRVEIAALRTGPVVTAGGVILHATVSLERVRGPVDTLLVPGGLATVSRNTLPEIPPLVRLLSGRCRRVASVCTGSFLLA